MNKNQTDNNGQKKPSKQTVIIAVIMAIAAILILLAIFVPLIRINSSFDRIFDDIRKIGAADITITDMSAENVFGNSKGEVSLVSEDLAFQLCEISEKFKYDGKDADVLGAWDIRFRVKFEGKTQEVYLSKDKIYYVSDNTHYNFVPEDDDAKREYAAFYENIQSLLTK